MTGSLERLMDGKRILVTGGFGILGAAVADALSRNGAIVTMADRAAPPAGLNHQNIAGVDLADPVTARETVEQARAKMGGLDGLANIAGAFRWETIEGGNPATWDFLFNVNLKTALCTSQAALPFLRRCCGCIVNVGAAAAGKAEKGMGAYSASKAAVAKLTESLADEMKPHGIRVNAILPSIIDTPQNRRDMPDADHGKWVAPEALADVVTFLLSHQSRAITGALITTAGIA